MYKAIDVAQYIIHRYAEQNKTISNLKLQKVLYFVQAEFLVSEKSPCFDEQIEAWDIGVVIPDVYQRYRVFGGANIPVINRINACTIASNLDREMIDYIMNECGKYSTATLADIVYNQNPWKDNYVSGIHKVIQNEDIARFFEK